MCSLMAAVSGEAGWNIVRVSASVGGFRTPLTVSAAGAADIMRPAVKKRAIRVVVMRESLARRDLGGVVVVVDRGIVVVGVMRTGCSMPGVEIEVEEVVVVLRLRTDKIEGKCAAIGAWEGRWLIYLAGLLLSTPPLCRTHRLPASGSEVDGADSSLGANMIDCYGRVRRQSGWILGQESTGSLSTGSG